MPQPRASTRHYVIVWLWLMLLALSSFLLSFAHMGVFAPMIALSIGAAKATLIAVFFMDLIRQPSISRWAFALGIALAALLLVTVAADVLTRERPPLRQPGLAAPSPDHSEPRQMSTR